MRRAFYGLLICVLVLSACAAPAILEPTQPGVMLLATSPSPHTTTPSPFPTIAVPPTPIPSPTPSPTATPFPTLVLPTPTPYPDTLRFSIGESWEGREIWVWQFGAGPHTIVLVGGIHAGSEANTVRLAELLVSYFQRNPGDILPGVHLLIIPVANPDGLPRGNRLAGRLNAHQVDLNRNWGCEWSDDAYLRQTPVYPGPRPFSEAETLALRAFFLAVSPEAVLFYHSAAGGIFMGQCKDFSPGADWLGPLLAQATGYPQRRFTYYEVSGDATNWLAERGIPAAVVELISENSPEFDRNLAGVIALQCHFVLEDVPDARSDPVVQSLCPSE